MTKFFLSFAIVIYVSISPLFSQDTVVLDRVVAVVGNGIIKQSDLDKMYFQMRSQGFSAGNDLRCVVYEDLLFQKLLLDQAKIDSVSVTEEQVEEQINQRLKQFVAQIGSERKLEQYYGKKMFELREMFRPIIHDQLVTQQMQQKLVSDLEVTPSDVRTFYKKQDKDSLPMINMQYEIAQIVVEPKMLNSEKRKLRETLEGYRKRILAGESFNALAVVYSNDPASAGNGGELGFMSRAELVPEFAEAAFRLKPGEISRVVETEFGFHIIQMIEMRGDKANLKHILLTPKFSPAAWKKSELKADSVYSMVLADSLDFGVLAFKYSDDKNTKNNKGLYVNPYTGSSKFDAKQADPAIFYKVQKMKVGDVTKPMKVKNEKGKDVYKIIKLISKTDPHRANMKDDYQMIKEMALSDKKIKTLDEWSDKKKESTFIKIITNPNSCPLAKDGWIK